MISFSKRLKLAAVALAFGSVGVHAATVGLPISIQESAITGAFPNLFVADQLSGQYDEVVTFHSATNYSTAAIFNAGNWFFNGNPIGTGTQIGSVGGSSYSLYVKFIGSGTYAVDGFGGTTFSATSNAIQVWADPDRDTNYDVGSSASAVPTFADLVLVAGSNIADDRLLGSSNVTIAAGGNSSSGLANGNFEIVFGAFTLANPDGENYFVAPRPFHTVLDLNGNFQSIQPVSGSSVVLLNNSANAFFVQTVPEPGALALVGVALLGLGFAAKRRKSA